MKDPESIPGATPRKTRDGITKKAALSASARKLDKIKEIDWTETDQGKKINNYIHGEERRGRKKKGEQPPQEDLEMTYERRKILIGLEILRDPSQGAWAISRITGIPRETVRDIIRKEDFKIDMSVVISKLGQRILENAIEANDALNDIFMSEHGAAFIGAKDLAAIADKNIRLYAYMRGENVNPDGTEKEYQFRFADNLLEAGLRAKPKPDEEDKEEEDEE